MNEKTENAFAAGVKNYFKQNYGILIALGAMWVIFTIFGNNFLTGNNSL